ncbi:hypothetical protein [Desulfosporosinus sp.]|uniref:DUF7010 family protein n=1 Tax=Desulfosporosinus sp. TaxID=157907 RepID=UPI0025BCC9AB|nr:hypothetical protein [Desulfosporosinus sp.]MBC2723280.1 hypothetical protein [Desulfosporosinus sp.]MBC2725640.1 hypothetical protein [Desulfosporosinus sp.]
MNLEELRLNCAIKQKKGLHFILASIIIWCIILIIHSTSLPNLTKNLFTFCSTAPLMPLAFLVSKIIKVDFQNKENPLTNLGILFSANQMLYLLIAMWVYPTLPEKMLMVIAMIFGAHLLPYGWLYKSTSYVVFAILIPILSLIIGISFEPYMLAIMMIIIEILFSICLIVENKNINLRAVLKS